MTMAIAPTRSTITAKIRMRFCRFLAVILLISVLLFLKLSLISPVLSYALSIVSLLVLRAFNVSAAQPSASRPIRIPSARR